MLKDEFKRAQSQGLKAVELDVDDDNSVAKKVYEHLGMYLFSTVSAPLLKKHGFETHHRMRIEL
jgi:RimJ/RimL family protein N-acetyltransferase